MRQGDRRTTPTKYVNAWDACQAGVDTKAPLSEFYGAGGARHAAQQAPDTFNRWGITQGQGDLVGAILGRAAGAEGGRPTLIAGKARRRRRRAAGGAEGTWRTIQAGAQLTTAWPATRPRGPHGSGRARPPAPADPAPQRGPGRTGADLARRCSSCSSMVVLPILWTVLLAFQRVRLLNIRTGRPLRRTTPSTTSSASSPRRASGQRCGPRSSTRVGGTVGSIGLGLVAALALRAPFRGRDPGPGVDAAAVRRAGGRRRPSSGRSMLNPQFGIVNAWGTEFLGWDEPIAVPVQRDRQPVRASRSRPRC